MESFRLPTLREGVMIINLHHSTCDDASEIPVPLNPLPSFPYWSRCGLMYRQVLPCVFILGELVCR